MNKKIEIDKNKIDFDVLWKIGKIDVDKITFIKYNIDKNQSVLGNDKETIILSGVIGEEIHKCHPHIIQELRGRVGDVIKDFKTEKKGRLVKVSQIVEIENQEMK